MATDIPNSSPNAASEAKSFATRPHALPPPWLRSYTYVEPARSAASSSPNAPTTAWVPLNATAAPN